MPPRKPVSSIGRCRIRPLPALTLLAAAACGILACGGPSGGPEPVSLEIVSGNGQQAPAGSEVPEALQVRARFPQQGGGPAPDVVVSFRITAGGGRLSAGSSVTGPDGTASVRWTLGPAPVWNRLTAVAGAGQAEFRAWAEPGEPPDLELVFQAPAGFSSEGIAVRDGAGMFLGTDGGLLRSPGPGADPLPLPLTGEQVLAPLGLAFAASGDLYACDSRSPAGDVKRVAPDGSCTVLSPGFEGSPFALPNSLAVDARGMVYLTSTCDDRIFRIDPAGGETQPFLSLPGPNGIALDPEGEFLYITTENPAVFCDGPWIPGGLFRARLNPDGSPGEVEALVEDFAVAGDGLAFDAEGNLYVVFSGIQALSPGDLFTSVIYVYTPDGRFNPWIPVSIPADIFTNLAFGAAPFDPLSLYAYGVTGRVYRALAGIPGSPLPASR